MPFVGSTVWTSARKWQGNLLPALFWLPPAAIGLWIMVDRREILGPGLYWIASATVLGWLGLNFFGGSPNRKMRTQLEEVLTRKGKDTLPSEREFVGYSRPDYSGLLDAHEDVGFLCFFPDRLVFISDTRNEEITKTEARTVRFRPNVHTIVGLGRWVSIEGERAGKPFRFLIEPRSKRTMWGNRAYSKSLQSRIDDWQKA